MSVGYTHAKASVCGGQRTAEGVCALLPARGSGARYLHEIQSELLGCLFVLLFLKIFAVFRVARVSTLLLRGTGGS